MLSHIIFLSFPLKKEGKSRIKAREKDRMAEFVEADNAEAIIARIETKSRKIESLLKQ